MLCQCSSNALIIRSLSGFYISNSLFQSGIGCRVADISVKRSIQSFFRRSLCIAFCTHIFFYCSINNCSSFAPDILRNKFLSSLRSSLLQRGGIAGVIQKDFDVASNALRAFHRNSGLYQFCLNMLCRSINQNSILTCKLRYRSMSKFLLICTQIRLFNLFIRLIACQGSSDFFVVYAFSSIQIGKSLFQRGIRRMIPDIPVKRCIQRRLCSAFCIPVCTHIILNRRINCCSPFGSDMIRNICLKRFRTNGFQVIESLLTRCRSGHSGA